MFAVVKRAFRQLNECLMYNLVIENTLQEIYLKV